MLSRSTLSYVRDFFSSQSLRPNKQFSQNFLIDANIVRKILRTANVQEGDRVLEIGPGLGAMTEALAHHRASVVAIEKDCHFQHVLEQLPIVLYSQDFLTFSFDMLPWTENVKVIANLPYHITTPILTKLLLEGIGTWESITVMVQDEVARRLTSRSGGKDYGSLTVFLQIFSDPSYAFKVSKGCFFPQPSVESAVVHLKMKKQLPLDRHLLDDFCAFVRKSFQQRRKMLVNSLKDTYSKDVVIDSLRSIKLSDTVRAEDLTLDHYLVLFENITKQIG